MRKTTGQRRLSSPVDHIPLEARKPLDKSNTISPHGKGRRGEAIRLAYIRADHRQADDLIQRIFRLMGVIDVRPTHVAAGSGNASITEVHHFDNLT